MQPDTLKSESTGTKVIGIQDRRLRKHKQQTEAARARAMVELIATKCNRQTTADPIARFMEIVRPNSPKPFRAQIVTLLSDDYGYSPVQVRAYLTHFHGVTFTAARIKRLVVDMSAGDDAESLGARATKLLLEGKVQPAEVEVPKAKVSSGVSAGTAVATPPAAAQVTPPIRMPSAIRRTEDPEEEGMTMDECLAHRRRKESQAAIEARLPMEFRLINRDRSSKGLPEITIAEFRVKQQLPKLPDA